MLGSPPSTTQPDVKKHFTSSILLWERGDQSRQTGMDYWKGPHSGIIAATPGLEEYRQIHLAEHTTSPRRQRPSAAAPSSSSAVRHGDRGSAFGKFVKKDLIPALAGTGVLKELRTQSFMPWIESMWDTPNVAHDNPIGQRFHAAVILGFADKAARDTFFSSSTVEKLSRQLTPLASAIHAYDVEAALTYVKHGHALPHYEE